MKNDCVPLMYDNLSSLNLTKNVVQNTRKHIDITHHFLRDSTDKWIFCMKFRNVKDPISDIFTKPLRND